jgi:hypothetical protein
VKIIRNLYGGSRLLGDFETSSTMRNFNGEFLDCTVKIECTKSKNTLDLECPVKNSHMDKERRTM